MENYVKPMSLTNSTTHRRRFLGGAISASALIPAASILGQTRTSNSGALTKEQRDRMTPNQVLDELKAGNERFQSGKMIV